jgi:hypothetical protein
VGVEGEIMEDKSYNVIRKMITLNKNLIRPPLILGPNTSEVVLFKKNKGRKCPSYETVLKIIH